VVCDPWIGRPTASSLEVDVSDSNFVEKVAYCYVQLLKEMNAEAKFIINGMG
jgi:hypothetical protein